MFKLLVQYFKTLLSMQQPIGAASNLKLVEIVEETDDTTEKEHEQITPPKFDW